jgi:uncharacterized protein
MSDQIVPDVTSDDKLWALLAYVLSPLVPIIILLMEDKKNRPYLKVHTYQALVLGVIGMIISIVLSWTVCIPFVIWGILIYYGVQAYNAKPFVIPVVTDFCKNQGWV